MFNNLMENKDFIFLWFNTDIPIYKEDFSLIISFFLILFLYLYFILLF